MRIVAIRKRIVRFSYAHTHTFYYCKSFTSFINSSIPIISADSRIHIHKCLALKQITIATFTTVGRVITSGNQAKFAHDTLLSVARSEQESESKKKQ